MSPGSVEGVALPESIEYITQASSCHPHQVTGLMWSGMILLIGDPDISAWPDITTWQQDGRAEWPHKWAKVEHNLWS